MLLLVGLAGLNGCTKEPASPVLPPAEVLKRIHDLNGQVVAVGGWLGSCSADVCGLYQNEADLKVVEQGDRHSKEWLAAINRSLSVGSHSWWFEWRENSLEDQYVVVRGRVTDECHDPTGTYACFDGPSDIELISIHETPAPNKVN